LSIAFSGGVAILLNPSSVYETELEASGAA
jgi:hypothetical protein